MLQPPDIVVLFALLNASGGWTLRSLADQLGVKHSKVQRALERLANAGLYDPVRRRAIDHAALEFIEHGLRYMHPARSGAVVRGVPTAWAAAPLSAEISSDDLPPVWPEPTAEVLGQSIEPLDPSLPKLAERWPEVAELAALADALRLGDARSRAAAQRHLRERIGAG
jgi:DNA-binding transcriptional MocR family regulator